MKKRPVMMITGAVQGLAQALAEQLADDYRLVLVDRDRKAGEALTSTLRQDGAQVFFCRADVRREADLQQAMARAQRRWGRLDVVVNAAATVVTGAFEATSLDSWQTLWRLNVMGAVQSCRAALPLMTAQGQGYLVNIADISGITAPPGMTAQAAGNAALIAFSEALASELSGSGIKVSVVCPAPFHGPSPTPIEAPDRLSRARLEQERANAEDVDQVAAAIIKAMARQPLYIFPQARARRVWRRKRWWPVRFARRMAALGERRRRYS